MEDYMSYCNETRVLNSSSAEGDVCLNSSETTPLKAASDGASSSIDAWIVFVCVVYGAICLAGTIGNGLVVYVVVRYSKMRSVPNMYLFNLAVSDICFLLLLPFLIVTALRKMWVFGEVLCKLFYIMTSLNWFANVFTLIVMSADRYMAVCHPVSSMKYRTSGISSLVCLSVWVVSTLFMLPICLYAEAVEEQGVMSCTIKWPKNETIAPEKAFIWYAMLIGFAVPMVLISAFYVLVILRLKTCGPKKKSGEPKLTSHSHRRVTRMVLAVVTVHVVCWLPYWVFQVIMTFVDEDYVVPAWQVLAFQFATILSYTNSVFNPLLYAFLGDNFRQTFARSIACYSRQTRPSMRMSEMSCRSNRTTTLRSLRRSPAPTTEKEIRPMREQKEPTAFVVRGEMKMELVLLQVPNDGGGAGGSYSLTSSSCAVSIIEDLNRNADDDDAVTRRHLDGQSKQQQQQQGEEQEQEQEDAVAKEQLGTDVGSEF